MEFIKEVGKCQVVVNDSSGGGVIGEPRFRIAPGNFIVFRSLPRVPLKTRGCSSFPIRDFACEFSQVVLVSFCTYR